MVLFQENKLNVMKNNIQAVHIFDRLYVPFYNNFLQKKQFYCNKKVFLDFEFSLCYSEKRMVFCIRNYTVMTFL